MAAPRTGIASTTVERLDQGIDRKLALVSAPPGFGKTVVDYLVEEVFPLDQAATAHTLSETGHGRGRIVLKVR